MASAAERRSPRTRVKSEASMATSLPLPIARPRSAWASAAASLTPSPTMATTRPSLCSRLTTSTLSEGRTSEMTSSMPTSAATDWAARALSPVSRTGDRLSWRRSATASADVSFTLSATTRSPRISPSQPTHTGVRPSISAASAAATSSGSGWRDHCSASQRCRPTITARPATMPDTPSPL